MMTLHPAEIGDIIRKLNTMLGGRVVVHSMCGGGGGGGGVSAWVALIGLC